MGWSKGHCRLATSVVEMYEMQIEKLRNMIVNCSYRGGKKATFSSETLGFPNFRPLLTKKKIISFPAMFEDRFIEPFSISYK